MSIIYNNQVVAGKYTQQVVADADTINAGIIKIATEEQVNEGTDNTTAVTPFYLAQKQDKISAGDGIVIDNNEISCTVNPDEQTIVRKNNGTMQCIGQLTKSNTLKFDWEGTQAEYNVAYLNGTIQPDWYCYITDDEEFVDYGDIANQSLSNLKAEGEARFTAKADKATTLNGYGITDGLNKNQITNCLLEIPQKIKYTFENGVFTLKAGSIIPVPNGEFEEVVIESDLSVGAISVGSAKRFVAYNNGSLLIGVWSDFQSGTTPTSTGYYYHTSEKRIYANGVVLTNFSLPLMVGDYTQDYGFTSIDQVFNGFGCVGNHIWCDKGIKLLITNGYNADGTINNIEFTTPFIMSSAGANTNSIPFIRSKNGDIRIYSISTANFLGELDYVPNIRSIFEWYFNKNEMKWYMHEMGETEWYETPYYNIAHPITVENGVITSFKPYKPFRAVDYSDSSTVSGWTMPSNRYIDLTLGASGTEYTAPANGYFLIIYNMTGNSWCNCFNNSSFIGIYNTYSTATAEGARAWCPVKKDDICKIYYQNIGNANLKFIYAEGEQ